MDSPLWLQIWQQKTMHIAFFAAFLGLIFLVFIFRGFVSRRKGLLSLIRYTLLGISLVYVGLILKAQPTTTNLIIFFSSLSRLTFPIQLYMLEPYIFLSFIFILITLLIWGRGVFCGWLCPYGSLVELLSKAWYKLLPRITWSLPGALHFKLIYLKYVIFIMIIGISFYSFILS